MNAPVFSRELRQSTATLTLYALFHLNLAFSSIEEEQRGQVIERCYWPLLRLAERCGPIAIEASGFTLEEIVSRDRLWIEKLQALIQAGKVEFVGSGYAQIIAPLVPARVTEANLALGHEVYQRLLGVKPALALVNEQAWSGGLVGLYLNAGYRGVLMDWDNPSAYHPEWPAETRYRVERALGSDGRTIPLLWTNTVAFQKLQRLAHGDIALAAWLDFFRQRLGEVPRALCCYSNDAEIFDFRPGRYRTEEAPSATSEWERLEQAFAALHASDDFNLVKPSSLLPAVRRQPLRLESAACPVPVKKQRKYNLSRWAVSGRDDVAINAACQRIYDGMCSDPDADWKELCYLWSSDFRT
ncbi:MAG: glycoside hydrolase family 57, partial [Alphaproteobacteria bacterium]|nr:glycoside hydrolase family 57 [Alphaproteobacteria bacterium]